MSNEIVNIPNKSIANRLSDGLNWFLLNSPLHMANKQRKNAFTFQNDPIGRNVAELCATEWQ